VAFLIYLVNNVFMNNLNDLKKELNDKIHDLFKDNQGYLNYLLQTKQNFIYRYLETSTDQNIGIKSLNDKTLVAISYESNMGNAFKISDPEIKEGIKALAKAVAREKNPRVQYSLKTTLENLQNVNGKVIIEAQVNWGFPDFQEQKGTFKKKQVVFEYSDPNVFRKELALKYEEACDLFN
jgi:hypothetical protein